MDEKRFTPGHRTIPAAGMSTVICVVLLLSLSLWNFAETHRQHKRNPVPGSFYSIEGRPMHIDCSGGGSPVVILEAAASTPWSEWRLVLPGLTQLTQVCSYDRAGHGWSEPRDGPRAAETIVRELHLLLIQAGLKPPLILVGHSAGGLYVRE